MGEVSSEAVGNTSAKQETDASPAPQKSRPAGTAKRKKVHHACVYCRRSHMTCDAERPCARCVKRNIGHLCHDEFREPKSKSPRKESDEVPSTQSTPAKPLPIIGDGVNSDKERMKPPNGPAVYPSSPVAPGITSTPKGGPTSVETGPSQSVSNPASTLSNNDSSFASEFSAQYEMSLFGLPQDPYSQFASEHTNSEFLVLSDFLSIMGDTNGTMSGNPTPSMGSTPFINENNNVYTAISDTRGDALTAEQQLALQANSAEYTHHASIPHSRAPSNSASRVGSRRASPSGNERPSASENQTLQEKFFLTAADPNPESPEDRLKQVINAKVEAGLMKPFNYVRGYARLQKYMDQNMSPDSRSRILAPLSTFRPAFRAIAKRLTDVDLILVEEAFERLLLDYDRVFTSMAVPACLWRRTGEIFRGNKEFAALLNLPVESLRDGKLAITELMAEDSAVNYWEKYGRIAFDGQQKAVLTSCLLQVPGDQKGAVVSCCFSFTIKRDRYNIPSCIVGNFIPISI